MSFQSSVKMLNLYKSLRFQVASFMINAKVKVTPVDDFTGYLYNILIFACIPKSFYFHVQYSVLSSECSGITNFLSNLLAFASSVLLLFL